MAQDTFDNVAQGTAGSGAAFLLPNDAPDPIAQIQRNREQAQLQKDKVNLAHQKNLQDMDAKFGTALPQDYPFLEALKDHYTQASAYEYQQGRDPQDPTNPNFRPLQDLKQKTMDAFNTSRQQQVAAAALQKTISDHPDKFDTEGSQHLLDLYLNGFNNPIERSKNSFPNPITAETPFNKMVEEYQKSLPELPSNVDVKDLGKYRKETTNTGWQPEMQSYYAQKFRTLYPGGDTKKIQPEVADLQKNNPVAYQRLVTEAQKDTEKLKGTPYETTITPDDVYTVGYLPTLSGHQQKVQTQNNPAKTIVNVNNGDGGSGDANVDEAKQFIQSQRLILNRDPSVVTPITKDDLTNYGTNFTQPDQKGKQVPIGGNYIWKSDAQKGFPMGKRYVTPDGQPAEVSTQGAKQVPDNIVQTFVDDKGNGYHVLDSGKKVFFNKNGDASVTNYVESTDRGDAYKKATNKAAYELGIYNNGVYNWEMPHGSKPIFRTKSNVAKGSFN